MIKSLRKIYKAGCSFGLWLMEVGRTNESHKDENSQQRSEDQAGSANYYQLVRGKLVKHMAAVIIGLIATVVLGIAGVVASHGQRSASIWLCYLAFILYGFVGFKTWDDSGPSHSPPPPEPPRGVTGTPLPVAPIPAPPLPRPTPRFSEVSENLTLYMGGIPMQVSRELIAKGIPPLLAIQNKPVLKAKLRDNTLFVDADIYWKDGAMPIKLVDNVLSSRPPGWDRNFNDRAIEIVNSDNIPIFQLVYAGKDAAFIRGVFMYNGTAGTADDFGLSNFPVTSDVLDKYHVQRIW